MNTNQNQCCVLCLRAESGKGSWCGDHECDCHFELPDPTCDREGCENFLYKGLTIEHDGKEYCSIKCSTQKSVYEQMHDDIKSGKVAEALEHVDRQVGGALRRLGGMEPDLEREFDELIHGYHGSVDTLVKDDEFFFNIKLMKDWINHRIERERIQATRDTDEEWRMAIEFNGDSTFYAQTGETTYGVSVKNHSLLKELLERRPATPETKE